MARSAKKSLRRMDANRARKVGKKANKVGRLPAG